MASSSYLYNFSTLYLLLYELMVYDGIWYAFLHLHLYLHCLGSMFICDATQKTEKTSGL